MQLAAHTVTVPGDPRRVTATLHSGRLADLPVTPALARRHFMIQHNLVAIYLCDDRASCCDRGWCGGGGGRHFER